MERGILTALVFLLVVGCAQEQIITGPTYVISTEEASIQYDPMIEPSEFVGGISNKYFTLMPGKVFKYSGGNEYSEVQMTNESKVILGVPMTVVWDRVWRGGQLIEDTRDWFAQDLEGNVWYFGEDSKDIRNGTVVSTEGSWEAGVDGAKAGIIMKGDPKVGDSYRQEYYPGEAEDTAEVVALGRTVTVSAGTFTDCLETREWTPLEPDVEEHKFYCPSIGMVVLEIDQDGNRFELVNETPSTQELNTQVTQDEAITIALARVPGHVTDVALERKFGEMAFVVEIRPEEGGPETDVIVDVQTGTILGVET